MLNNNLEACALTYGHRLRIACHEQDSSARTIIRQVSRCSCYKVVPLYAGHDRRQSKLWYGLDTQDSGANQEASGIPARSQILPGEHL
jgi:hypothetical protein